MLRSNPARVILARPSLKFNTRSSERYVVPRLYRPSRRFYNGGPRRTVIPSNLPIYMIIGVCCGGYGVNWVAEVRAQRGDRELKEFIDRNFVFSPEALWHARIHTALTCSLMHFNAWHLIANMIAFRSFGSFIKIYLGMRTVVAMWVGGTMMGSFFQFFWDERGEQVKAFWRRMLGMRPSRSSSPAGPANTVCIGASSGIFSMAAIMWMVMPTQKMYIMPIPIPLPAGVVGLASIGLSSYCLVEGLVPWISHAGHLGGIFFGTWFWAARLAPWARFR